jgi:hypothetical protein
MRKTSLPTHQARCRSMHSLYLVLLVAACSNMPAPPSVTAAASEPAPAATISTYHGYTSTVFAVAWSPDG